MSSFNYYFDTPLDTLLAATPADAPTDAPTNAPSDAPSDAPSNAPSIAPVDAPADAPTDAPSIAPADVPADAPAAAPADAPADAVDPWKAAGYTEGDEARCRGCGREFNSRRGLMTHITSHTSTCRGVEPPPRAPPRPRTCHWCGIRVDSDKALRMHISAASSCNRSESAMRGNQQPPTRKPPVDHALAKMAEETAREACVRRLDAVRAYTAATIARQKVSAAAEALAAAEHAADAADRQAKALAEAADEAAAAAKLARETIAEYEQSRVFLPRTAAIW